MTRTIEEWYDANDGDDIAPAWSRCMASLRDDDPSLGDEVVFGAKVYNWRSGPCDVTRNVRVRGAGALNTMWDFWSAPYGARFWSAQESGNPRPGCAGTGAHLRGVYIRGSHSPQSQSGVVVGASTVSISDVHSGYWKSDGFAIVADAVASKTNANQTRIYECRAYWNARHGYYFQGGDSNACLISGCDATSNAGDGFHDQSFLGNHFVACLAQANVGRTFVATGLNQRGTFVGCYQEQGQPLALINAPNCVMGMFGLLDPASTALALSAGAGIASISPTEAKSSGSTGAATRLGAAPDSPLELRSALDTYGYAFARELSGPWAGWWTVRQANAPSRAVLAMRADAKTGAPIALAAPQGMTLGPASSGQRALAFRATVPSATEGADGDCVVVATPNGVSVYRRDGGVWTRLALT